MRNNFHFYVLKKNGINMCVCVGARVCGTKNSQTYYHPLSNI